MFATVIIHEKEDGEGTEKKKKNNVNDDDVNDTQGWCGVGDSGVGGVTYEAAPTYPHPKRPKELRCVRCQNFYFDCDNTETSCKYHSGKFRSLISGGSGLINMSQAKKWSCCKRVEEAAVGCRTAPHTEDTEFTNFLIDSYSNIERYSAFSSSSSSTPHMPPRRPRVFQTNTKSLCDSDTTAMSAQNENENERGDGHEEESVNEKPRTIDTDGVPAGYQRHVVHDTDTMRRLELAYDVSAAEIKAANQIVNDREIHSRPFLLIPSTKVPNLPVAPPISQASREHKRVSVFMQITKCKDHSEAKAYLDMANWDVNEAVIQYKKDVQWETVKAMQMVEKDRSCVCCW